MPSNLQHSSMRQRQILLLSPFYGWGNRSTDCLGNLPKVFQLVGKRWDYEQGLLAPKSYSQPLC